MRFSDQAKNATLDARTTGDFKDMPPNGGGTPQTSAEARTCYTD